MPTVAYVKKRIADTLDREDLEAYIDTWMYQAHFELQQQADWSAQQVILRIPTTGVVDTITLPLDYKGSAGSLRFVGGVDPLIPLVTTGLYELVDIDDLWDARTVEGCGNAYWAISGTTIYINPSSPPEGNQLVLMYDAILPLPEPEATNWFFTFCFSYLMYESLLQSIPFLGGADDRAVSWTQARDRSLQWAIATDIARKTGSGPLWLRG